MKNTSKWITFTLTLTSSKNTCISLFSASFFQYYDFKHSVILFFVTSYCFAYNSGSVCKFQILTWTVLAHCISLRLFDSNPSITIIWLSTLKKVDFVSHWLYKVKIPECVILLLLKLLKWLARYNSMAICSIILNINRGLTEALHFFQPTASKWLHTKKFKYLNKEL